MASPSVYRQPGVMYGIGPSTLVDFEKTTQIPVYHICKTYRNAKTAANTVVLIAAKPITLQNQYPINRANSTRGATAGLPESRTPNSAACMTRGHPSRNKDEQDAHPDISFFVFYATLF